jgi:hypothetical protein
MQHLDQKGLADRWLVSPRTLEQWRWQGKGPRYLKIGGRVVYREEDVTAFEATNLHANTVGPIRESPEEDRSNAIPATNRLVGRKVSGSFRARVHPRNQFSANCARSPKSWHLGHFQ